MKENQDKINF